MQRYTAHIHHFFTTNQCR